MAAPEPSWSRRFLSLTAILCLLSVASVSGSHAASKTEARHPAVPVANETFGAREAGIVWIAQTAQGIQSAQAGKAETARRAYRRREYKTAVKIWSELAATGDPEAQSMLGVIYENGEGVALDLVEAAKWYRKAADRGYAEAQLNLGVLYENGEGVEKDPVQAAKWYRKAARQGELLAQYTLGLMYRKGRGVPHDNEQAAHWLGKVAERGYAVA